MITLALAVLLCQDAEVDRKVVDLRARALEKSKVGDLVAAAALMDEAVKLAPTSALSFALRGQIHYERNKPEAAVRDYDRALELGLDQDLVTDCRRFRAWANMSLLKFAPALDDLQRLVKADPRDVDALHALAMLAVRMGAEGEMRRAAEKLREVNPNHAPARGLLAELDLRKGRMEEAIAGFREVQRLDPSDTQSAPCIGMALHLQGKSKEALAVFEKAAENPAAIYAGLWVWKLRSEQGDREGGRRMLERMVQSDDNAWHRSLASRLAGRIGDDELSRAAAGNPSETVERRTEADFFLATQLLLAGDRAGAVGRFKKCKDGAVWYLEPLMAAAELKRLGE